MIDVTAAPIVAAAFAPYGQMLAGPGTRDRLDHAGLIENLRPRARPNLLLARGRPSGRSRRLDRLERHPFSSQFFAPLAGTAYHSVVCLDDGSGRPALETLRAFIVPGTCAINLRAGVWHAPLATLDAEGPFSVLVHEDGTADDCHWAEIEAIAIGWPPA